MSNETLNNILNSVSRFFENSSFHIEGWPAALATGAAAGTIAYGIHSWKTVQLEKIKHDQLMLNRQQTKKYGIFQSFFTAKRAEALSVFSGISSGGKGRRELFRTRRP